MKREKLATTQVMKIYQDHSKQPTSNKMVISLFRKQWVEALKILKEVSSATWHLSEIFHIEKYKKISSNNIVKIWSITTSALI